LHAQEFLSGIANKLTGNKNNAKIQADMLGFALFLPLSNIERLIAR
jgi:hypothetical protein